MPKCLNSVAREKFAALFEGSDETRLTLETVAKALGGLHFSHVSMIKNGRRKPTFTVAAAIEREYGIPMIEWSQKPVQHKAGGKSAA